MYRTNALELAIAPVIGALLGDRFNTPGDKAGGAGDTKAADDKAAKDGGQDGGKASDDKAGDPPAKLTLTQAELEAQVAAAVAKREKELADAAAAEKAKAEREAKKKAGDVQGLYDSELAKTRELEAKLAAQSLAMKKRDVEIALRDALAADEFKAYATAAKWIMPAIAYDAETDDEEIAKRVKAAVKQYAADNPRGGAAGAGTPGASPRGKSTDNKGASNGNANGNATPPQTVKPPQYLRAF